MQTPYNLENTVFDVPAGVAPDVAAMVGAKDFFGPCSLPLSDFETT